MNEIDYTDRTLWGPFHTSRLSPPEGHRPAHDASLGDGFVWCPWAYKDVALVNDYNDWPTCNGCLRHVDTRVVFPKKGD